MKRIDGWWTWLQISHAAITLSQSLLLTVLKFTDCHDSDTKPFYYHCWEINTTACDRLNMMLVQVPVSQNRGFFGLIIFNEIEFCVTKMFNCNSKVIAQLLLFCFLLLLYCILFHLLLLLERL